MRNLQSDVERDEALEQSELQKLQITAPVEAQATTSATPPSTTFESQPLMPSKTEPASQSFVRPSRVAASAAEARFEKILQHELSGTSFTFETERKNPNLSMRATTGQEQPRKKLIPLSKAKKLKTSPFEGVTILDKLVSFVAYLLKALERWLFRGKVQQQQKPQTPIKSLPADQIPIKKGKSAKRWIRWSRM